MSSSPRFRATLTKLQSNNWKKSKVIVNQNKKILSLQERLNTSTKKCESIAKLELNVKSKTENK